MIDPAVKTALAFCVLLAGVCAALLFRRDPAQPAPAVPQPAEQLLIHPQAEPHVGEVPAEAPGRTSPAAQRTASRAAGRAATIVPPSDRLEPPPALADSYPRSARLAGARWGMSMDMVLPADAASDDTARTHTIVDGDTLAALAQRYLGSAARAMEIYEANRDVLTSPALLPIGSELKIPPRRVPSAGASVRPSDGSMVVPPPI